MENRMELSYFNRLLYGIIVIVLIILSFLVLKPILLSIVLGFILAFIFSPIYKILFKITKSPNFSATLICIGLIFLILIPLWFLIPILLDQAFKVYVSTQKADFISIFKSIFPSLFSSNKLPVDMIGIFQRFITKAMNSFLNNLSDFILNFPVLLLHSLVVLFTFFFALRDRKEISAFVKSLSPFSRDIEAKLFRYSKDITTAVLYGQVILGVIQGLIVSLGFFLFKVPNALLLSISALIAGILPIIGPMVIWIPVMIYLFVQSNSFAAIGVLVFGMVGSNIDTILRPLFVSKMAKIHSGIVLIGMIGGLFLFGVLGLILGPLILSYLLIILEIYKDKNIRHKRKFEKAIR